MHGIPARQERRASPHVSQRGSARGRMAPQHASQTAPLDGASSGSSHEAQTGANRIAIAASAQRAISTASCRVSGGGRLLAHGIVADVDSLRVAPEAFQRIKAARLWSEDVDDEAEVIHQEPVGAVVPFDVCRAKLRRAERFLHRVGYRLHLPLAVARTQYEEIGE